MSLKSKEHSNRILTALAGVSIIGGIYYALDHVGVVIIASVLAIVAFYEFVSLSLSPKNTASLIKAKKAVAILAAILFLLPTNTGMIWPLCLLIAFALTCYRQGSKSIEFSDQSHHIHDLFAVCFGLFYVVHFFLFVPQIHKLPSGPIWLAMLLGIIWGGDIAAYYAGNLFGKHKLSPSISPGKTLEGALGNFVASTLLALAVWRLFLYNGVISDNEVPVKVEFSALSIVGLALVTSFVSQIGDLFESAIKRVAGKKDSGTILPGHGGILDRFDSLIMAAPFFYYYLSQLIR